VSNCFRPSTCSKHMQHVIIGSDLEVVDTIHSSYTSIPHMQHVLTNILQSLQTPNMNLDYVILVAEQINMQIFVHIKLTMLLSTSMRCHFLFLYQTFLYVTISLILDVISLILFTRKKSFYHLYNFFLIF